MRALTMSALMAGVLALASMAQAAPGKTARPISPAAQMNKLIGSVCKIELGNGTYAFKAYNPAAYKRADAVKQIATDMKGFEAPGVKLKTFCGPTQVKRELTKLLGEPQTNAATLCNAIDGFQKLGVLQDVVYRGLIGGKAVGDTYFSIPHQVFFCLKTPTQKGKRVEVFMELGD